MPIIYRDGDSIYYEFTKTKKNNDTLIFIHGVGLDHLTWETFVPLFKNHYNIVRYDLRGHGNSDKGDKTISWETFYEDLLYIVETLHIQSFHLIGHGFGCNIATNFAFINPDIVKSLILLSFVSIYPTSIAQKLGETRKAQYKVESMVSVGEKVLAFATRLSKNSEPFKKLLSPYANVSVETYFNIYQLMIQSKSTDYLQHIHIPSLILAGELDPIYPPFLSNMSALYLSKSHFLIVPGSSNMMYIDQPEVTFQWIHNFILDLDKDTQITYESSYDKFFDEIRSKFQDIFREGEKKVDSTNELKIDLLQTFHVYVNGEEILEGWNQRNAKQILVYLIFHRTVIREQLCDELWSDIPLRKSRNNLRVYLSHLKKLLDYEGNTTQFLVMDNEHINLQGRVKCDLIDFYEEVNKAIQEKEINQKSIMAQKIFHNAPRNLLIGLYENWILELREELESKLFNLAQWMGDFYFDKNQNSKALEYYRLANQYRPDDCTIEYKITKLRREN
ncbi:alpha/beta fold hydrolase [Ectobacillus sp. sgz5001026]|uniref:alpha/beta fold hydrolase n=1 Tax=Ectobacillus sp. sgz5001026 TaxID=3242473 RepID=UPI0036D25D1F